MYAFRSAESTPSILLTKFAPAYMPLEDINKPARTISFTAFAFAPGVLKTTTPFSEHSSTGTLLYPAPALATALRESFNSSTGSL